MLCVLDASMAMPEKIDFADHVLMTSDDALPARPAVADVQPDKFRTDACRIEPGKFHLYPLVYSVNNSYRYTNGCTRVLVVNKC